MKAIILPAALAALLVAGCTTPAYVSPVEVTRFTGAQPAVLGSGPIAIVAAPGTTPDSWDYAAYEQAVASELAALGYFVTPESSARQVAEISIDSALMQRDGGSRSPVSVGVGGSTGSYGSGMGVGVGINLGGNQRSGDEVATELRVTIKPRGDVNALWEGRARFTASANSEYADRNRAASRLADALFSGFPGRSGETIEIE